MRKARDPTHPAGGSTTVKGRRSDESGSASALTVQATGLMVTDDHSAPPSPQEGDDAVIAPPPLPTERSLLPLQPRAAWMMEDDPRSDEQADEDWRKANTRMFGTPGPLTEQAAAGADGRQIHDRIFGAQSPHTELEAPKAPSPPPGSRMSFFDEEYVGGQRVPSPTEGEATPDPSPIDARTSSAVAREPPADIANLRDRIYHNLIYRTYMPEFPAARIPSPMFNPSVHLAMVDLVAQRNKTEADLSDMLLDKAADGTLLDPNRDYEQAY